ncbi:uncharacterized protein LOC142923202 [Petromyzon marinus]|uniref:uncharacterized protein LOC142923202 n=1 Tax=Petromyzon marinus TaxID=7757 RepID=UPI003F7045C7
MAHSQAINSLQVELEAVRWGEREEQLRREHDATLHLAYIELAEYRASHMHDNSEYDAHVVHITVLQKALKERDELLRRSEADLVAAREEARERGTETERLGTEAAELRANMRDLFTNQEVQQTEVDNLRHEVLELQQRLQEANACCEETGNSLEQQTDFLKAELGVSRAEEAARAQEVVQLQHTLQHTDAEMECMHGQIAGLQHQLKESEGHVQALGMEKAQQQDAHRKEACELATGLEEVRLTLTDAFKQFERNSKKAQEDEDTITRLKEELKASKEELAASEAERASAQPELSTPQQGLSALQDQLTTSQAENEDTLRQLFERSQELGSLHAGILWYQRMLAELHTELEQYRENAQIGRSQLQHLDMLRQQSEAEVSTLHSHVADKDSPYSLNRLLGKVLLVSSTYEGRHGTQGGDWPAPCLAAFVSPVVVFTHRTRYSFEAGSI